MVGCLYIKTNYVEVLLRCLYGNIILIYAIASPYPPLGPPRRLITCTSTSLIFPSAKFLGQTKPDTGYTECK